MKGNKGITLIALVITIIILLILAGVSVAMIAGSNGILNQTTDARDNTRKAEYVERINTCLTAVKMKIYKEQITDATYNGEDSTSTPAVLASNIVEDVLEVDFKVVKDASGNVLEADSELVESASPEGKYGYSYAGGVLTLKYINGKEGITDEEPIEGSITLGAGGVINGFAIEQASISE